MRVCGISTRISWSDFSTFGRTKYSLIAPIDKEFDIPQVSDSINFADIGKVVNFFVVFVCEVVVCKVVVVEVVDFSRILEVVVLVVVEIIVVVFVFILFFVDVVSLV